MPPSCVPAPPSSASPSTNGEAEREAGSRSVVQQPRKPRQLGEQSEPLPDVHEELSADRECARDRRRIVRAPISITAERRHQLEGDRTSDRTCELMAELAAKQ